MQQRRLGTSGPELPVIGQGTWKMESDDRAAAIAALRRGIDLGMTHIDTAEMYGNGRVEEIVGEALAAMAERHGASARQVALQFLLRDEAVLTIPKATQLAHVEDNAAAAGLELSAGELERLDRAFPPGPHRDALPMI